MCNDPIRFNVCRVTAVCIAKHGPAQMHRARQTHTMDRYMRMLYTGPVFLYTNDLPHMSDLILNAISQPHSCTASAMQCHISTTPLSLSRPTRLMHSTCMHLHHALWHNHIMPYNINIGQLRVHHPIITLYFFGFHSRSVMVRGHARITGHSFH